MQSIGCRKAISRFRSTVLAAMVATPLAISGCAPGANLAPLPDPTTETYTLGPDDVVHVITFNEAQLTGDFRVSENGTLSFPLIGVVKAQGLTPNQLADSISDQLKAKNLFRDPSVSASVTTYRSIFIIGEVAKPGEYPYMPGMTVLTAVAVGGGFTYRAVTDYASVVRKTGAHAVEGKVARQSVIEPGDVITIYERHF